MVLLPRIFFLLWAFTVCPTVSLRMQPPDNPLPPRGIEEPPMKRRLSLRTSEDDRGIMGPPSVLPPRLKLGGSASSSSTPVSGLSGVKRATMSYFTTPSGTYCGSESGDQSLPGTPSTATSMDGQLPVMATPTGSLGLQDSSLSEGSSDNDSVDQTASVDLKFERPAKKRQKQSSPKNLKRGVFRIDIDSNEDSADALDFLPSKMRQISKSSCSSSASSGLNSLCLVAPQSLKRPASAPDMAQVDSLAQPVAKVSNTQPEQATSSTAPGAAVTDSPEPGCSWPELCTFFQTKLRRTQAEIRGLRLSSSGPPMLPMALHYLAKVEDQLDGVLCPAIEKKTQQQETYAHTPRSVEQAERDRVNRVAPSFPWDFTTEGPGKLCYTRLKALNEGALVDVLIRTKLNGDVRERLRAFLGLEDDPEEVAAGAGSEGSEEDGMESGPFVSWRRVRVGCKEFNLASDPDAPPGEEPLRPDSLIARALRATAGEAARIRRYDTSFVTLDWRVTRFLSEEWFLIFEKWFLIDRQQVAFSGKPLPEWNRPVLLSQSSSYQAPESGSQLRGPTRPSLALSEYMFEQDRWATSSQRINTPSFQQRNLGRLNNSLDALPDLPFPSLDEIEQHRARASSAPPAARAYTSLSVEQDSERLQPGQCVSCHSHDVAPGAFLMPCRHLFTCEPCSLSSTTRTRRVSLTDAVQRCPVCPRAPSSPGADPQCREVQVLSSKSTPRGLTEFSGLFNHAIEKERVLRAKGKRVRPGARDTHEGDQLAITMKRKLVLDD